MQGVEPWTAGNREAEFGDADGQKKQSGQPMKSHRRPPRAPISEGHRLSRPYRTGVLGSTGALYRTGTEQVTRMLFG